MDCVGRHPDVHEHQVGGELAHEGQQLNRVPGLGDHVESGATEETRHSRTQKYVVIGDDDTQRGLC